MTPFKVSHATAEDWAHAAKACADGLKTDANDTLGFVYVTDDLSEDLSSVLTYLRQKTGVEHWVGSIGMGICAGETEYFDRPAVAAMVMAIPEDSFSIFPSFSDDLGQLPQATLDWIEKAEPLFGVVHGDPGNADTPDLINDLAELTSGFLVGGLTSSREANHQIADRMTGGGVSGILFAPEIQVATGLSQGCAPVAGTHVISDCLDNVIIGLDGHRALDVFKEDVGELLARDLSRVSGYIHAALPIEGSDTGDYMVRNLMGIDPVRGWLAIGEQIDPGDRVMFVRRDPESARDDLRAMLQNLAKRLPEKPRGGLYFSCIARGPSMFGEEGKEMAILRETFDDVPIVGFYANGEISNSRLYSYTGVLTLFM